MKNGKPVILLIMVLVAFASCCKEPTECALIPAKVIRYDCDRVIFQLLTSTAIGDPDWEDVQTGQHYSNVVSYFNGCRISAITNCEPVTLYVDLKEPDMEPIDDCIRCQAISQSPPQTMVDFGTISTSPCDLPAGTQGIQ